MSTSAQQFPDDMSPAIRISGLSKIFRIYDRPQDRLLQSLWKSGKPRYREFHALDDVSLEVRRGETVGIIGLNGSGKSTLLQLIAGTLAPTSGEVSVNGKISALLELGAGFNPEFTGRENIRMAATIQGKGDREDRQHYDRIAAFADIGDFIDQPVKTYSSGMYVRLAFAVAMLAEPDVLIVDEALAVGDMGFQAKCMLALKKMQERGASILFVTHDVSQIKALCHRALYLQRGRVLELGSASDVANRYIRDVQDAANREITGAEAVPAIAGRADHVRAGAAEERYRQFADAAEHCRSGTGDARVLLAELLDDQGRALASVGHGQAACIRIVVEAARRCAFSVNYKICDRNRIAVIGADFLMQNQALLALEQGQRAEVVYRTGLPLVDGKYTLRVSLTHPIDGHRHAIFFDIVEIAQVFEVLPNPQAKFWTQVYLPNTLETRIL